MPVLLSTEFSRQCNSAARSSRLDPYGLHPGEKQILKPFLDSAGVSSYLYVRNATLRLWIRNPSIHVSRDEAISTARNTRQVSLAVFAHEWLTRHGYINFGCLHVLDEVPHFPNRICRPRTVIVIGAGVAGLSCARHLENFFKQFASRWVDSLNEHPPRVVVLEARDRIGGRVYSHALSGQDNNAIWQGLANTAEVGAQIITGFEHGNPLNVIVRGQLALHYHLLRDDIVFYDFDGTVIDHHRDDYVQDIYNDILETASQYSWKPAVKVQTDTARTIIAPLKHASIPEKAQQNAFMNYSIKSKSLAEAKNRPTLGSLMDAMAEKYEREKDLSAQDLRILNWHFANLEYANAANVRHLSLGGWDQDSGNEFEGRHSQVIGGYSQVVHGLWKYPTTLSVYLNKRVTGIRYCDDVTAALRRRRVAISCADGTHLEGDAGVCTLPLGVLHAEHDHLFDPPLPAWKGEAMSRLGFGVLNKIILVFNEVFWDMDKDMFGLLNKPDFEAGRPQEQYSNVRGTCYLFWNCVRASGKPMLAALMAGDSAVAAETTDDHTLVSEATTRLATIFKLPAPPKPTEAIITRWRSDPFARGTYSYLGPDARPGDYESMAKEVGNLYFAGEATCGTHPATVHGAFLSGLRAAADVVNAMLGPVPAPAYH